MNVFRDVYDEIPAEYRVKVPGPTVVADTYFIAVQVKPVYAKNVCVCCGREIERKS